MMLQAIKYLDICYHDFIINSMVQVIRTLAFCPAAGMIYLTVTTLLEDDDTYKRETRQWWDHLWDNTIHWMEQVATPIYEAIQQHVEKWHI